MDDDVFSSSSAVGEIQESLPMRRARLLDDTANGTPHDTPASASAFDEPVKEQSEKEVLLLVDAANGFNNLSRYAMLWTVRHRCRKLNTFAFNCYRHEVRLVCRQPGGVPA